MSDGQLINFQTGEVLENPLQPVVDELEERILSLTKVIASRDRVITELRNDLATAMGDEPEADDIKRILSYWARKALATHWWQKSPRYNPGGPRWVAVRARLREGYTLEDCKAAIDGALQTKTEHEHRKCQGCGSAFPVQAWMDAASIFRNETNMERHMQHARDPEHKRVLRVAQSATVTSTHTSAPQLPTPFERVTRVLWREFGEDRVQAVWNHEKERLDCYMAPCPIHPNQPQHLTTMIVTLGASRNSSPSFFCAEGCDPVDLADAVRELERRWEVRQREAVARATAAEATRDVTAGGL